MKQYNGRDKSSQKFVEARTYREEEENVALWQQNNGLVAV